MLNFEQNIFDKRRQLVNGLLTKCQISLQYDLFSDILKMTNIKNMYDTVKRKIYIFTQ